MFINFSNHPSAQWPQAQTTAALAYGEIIDIPFPAVPSDATTDDICNMADEFTGLIMQHNPDAVMCQGEFTLAFAIVSQLISRGITVLAACSERKVVEVTENGITKKNAYFEFKRFREYVICG